MLSVILFKGKIMRVRVIVFCDTFICTYSKTFLWKIKATFFFIDLIQLCTGVLLNEHFEQALPSLVWNLDLENKNQTFMTAFLSRLLLQWSQPIRRPCVYLLLQISMNVDAIQAAFVLTSVRILLVPITALVPWDSNFQLMAGRVKVWLSYALAYSVRYSSLLLSYFRLILACKTAMEWHEKSMQLWLIKDTVAHSSSILPFSWITQRCMNLHLLYFEGWFS